MKIKNAEEQTECWNMECQLNILLFFIKIDYL